MDCYTINTSSIKYLYNFTFNNQNRLNNYSILITILLLLLNHLMIIKISLLILHSTSIQSQSSPYSTLILLTLWMFLSGDIGEILPNGAVKIIDRKKHLIKLSQGEYVALEHLEKVYGITPIVEDVIIIIIHLHLFQYLQCQYLESIYVTVWWFQIWVYGDSFKSSLVAVVVPNKEHVERWGHKNGHKNCFSSLCTLTQLQDYILCELKSTAQRNKVLLYLVIFSISTYIFSN